MRKAPQLLLARHRQIVGPRLSEIFCGAWEGLAPEERRRGWPALTAGCRSDLDLYDKAPGGEGLDGMERRITEFLGGLDGPAIIAAHKVVLIMLRGLLRGLEREALHILTAPQGVLIAIENNHEVTLV